MCKRSKIKSLNDDFKKNNLQGHEKALEETKNNMLYIKDQHLLTLMKMGGTEDAIYYNSVLLAKYQRTLERHNKIVIFLTVALVLLALKEPLVALIQSFFNLIVRAW